MTALAAILAAGLSAVGPVSTATAQEKLPNILFIMGDDIGWFNIGAYHRGIMSGKTPNLDELASQGMRSPTTMRRQAAPPVAPISYGRVADPHWTDNGRSGRRRCRFAGAAPTIATALKAMGYTTGQFGKNHLGDLNKYLPCVHGFDEFSVICITSTPCPIRIGIPIRRIQPSETLSGPETSFIAGRAIRTIQPSSRAGARSESKRSSTRDLSRQDQHRTHALWRRGRGSRRRQIRHDHLRRGTGQGFNRLHEEGQG